MRKLGAFGSLVLFVLCWPSPTRAQEFAGVTGSVVDAQEGAISGVTVELSNAKTGIHSTTVTDDQGVYQFLRLPPGPDYRLTFSKEGFQKLDLGNLTFGVNTTSTRNVTLRIGQVSQTLEVSATGAATLNTTDATVGNVFGSKLLDSLPVQF